jgi:hypothetical protein
MSLYVKIVQIVQRQGLAVLFRVVWFSLQEPVVCGLVAGLRVHQTTRKITASPCLCTICTIFTYKDIRNFSHAQCKLPDDGYAVYMLEKKWQRSASSFNQLLKIF